jgi:hypothetical protein
MTTPPSSMAPTSAQVGSDSPSNSATGQDAQSTMARVAEEAPAQAARVVDDARAQISNVTRRTLSDLRTQGEGQTEQAAHGLRGLAKQADALAEGRPDEAGTLGGIAQAFSQQASSFAERLESRGVQGLIDDTSRYVRQHPWAFLGMALGAGFLAGRLVRTSAAMAGDGESRLGQSTSNRQLGMTSQPSMTAPASSIGMPSPSATSGLRK